jgi:Rhamnogalacturonan I lyases beta-sheet domain
MAVVFAVLGILVIVSFFIYLSRLSDSPDGSGYSAGNQTSNQTKSTISVPENVTVTVDNGATISWDTTDDVRIIGYNVYRYKSGDDPGSKVNSAIISDTVYHDDEGTMFNSYAVATVDTNGREGAPSSQVEPSVEPVSLAGLTPTQEPQMVEDVTLTEPAEKELPPSFVSCTAAGMSYSGVWYEEHYAEVMGGVIMVTPYSGDSVSYTFSGESVAVVSTRHWNYGIMDIYVDGELRQQVDLYSPETIASDTVFSASGLGSGAHTIKLVCTGRKNSDANFTFINLEALQIR